MKKILSFFLVLVIMMSVLCAVPVSAENDYGICYTKVGNNIIVEAKGLGDKTADLYVASYRGGQLVMAECCEIDSLASNPLVMEDGLDYKFFVWEDNGKLTPVFDELAVNTQTPNGTGTAEKGEVIKVKAEVIKTPKSNPELCVDDSGKYMVELAIIESESDKLGSDAVYVYAGNTDVVNMNGWIVDAIIKEDTSLDAWVLESVSLDSAVGTVEITECLSEIVVDGRNIQYYATETDKRPSEIELSSSVTIYYNGAVLSNSDMEYAFYDLQTMLSSHADKILFMSSDNGKYDKIFVTDYYYLLVEAVDVSNKIIKFSPVGFLCLDKDKRKDPYFEYNIFDKNGNKMELSEIEQGDLINAVAPMDDYGIGGEIDAVHYLDIYVTNDKTTGIVESKTADNTVTINGEKYKSKISLTMGTEGTFHISVDGKIVKMSTPESMSSELAFYISKDKKETFGRTKYTLNLWTEEGEKSLEVASYMFVFDGDGNVTFVQGNESMDEVFGYYGDFERIYTDSFTKGEAIAKASERLLKYKTDESGKIIEIMLPGEDNNFWSSVKNTAAAYDESAGTFGGADVSDTTLIMVPVYEVDPSLWNVDRYDISTSEFSALEKNETYTSCLYYANGSDKPSAAVICDVVPNSFDASPLAVVKSTSNSQDADGNAVMSYTIVQGGEVKTVCKDFDIESWYDKELSVGDVFQYELNEDGEMYIIDIMYDVSERALSTYAVHRNIADHGVGYVFGVITDYGKTITLASEVDENLAPVKYTTLMLDDKEYITTAMYDEGAPRNAVKMIGRGDIKSTKDFEEIYTAVAKVDAKGKVEDIVVVALDPNEFNSIESINAFTNWKITY